MRELSRWNYIIQKNRELPFDNLDKGTKETIILTARFPTLLLIFRNTTLKKGTKNSGENKSQLIRDYAAANPGLGPTQIANALKEQGIDAYPALVIQALRKTTGAKSAKPKTAKAKAVKKRGRPAKAKTAKATGKASSTTTDYSILKDTAEFVKKCGSPEQAIESIKVFKHIASLLNG